MLLAIFFVVLLAWGIGMVTAYTLGGLIHLLLLIAAIILLIEYLDRRKAF